jgi:hypothetical protein
MARTPDPFNLQLEQVLPGVMSSLNLLSQQLTNGFGVENLQRTAALQELSTQIKEIKTSLQPMSRTLSNMRFEIISTVNMARGNLVLRPDGQFSEPSNSSINSVQSNDHMDSHSVQQLPSITSECPRVNSPGQSRESNEPINDETEDSPSPSPDTTQNYKIFAKADSTIEQLWKEWDEGLDGNLPVRQMFFSKVNYWPGQNERQQFKRYFPIWWLMETKFREAGSNPRIVLQELIGLKSQLGATTSNSKLSKRIADDHEVPSQANFKKRRIN